MVNWRGLTWRHGGEHRLPLASDFLCIWRVPCSYHFAHPSGQLGHFSHLGSGQQRAPSTPGGGGRVHPSKHTYARRCATGSRVRLEKGAPHPHHVTPHHITSQSSHHITHRTHTYTYTYTSFRNHWSPQEGRVQPPGRQPSFSPHPTPSLARRRQSSQSNRLMALP